jgi:hypothetical protein
MLPAPVVLQQLMRNFFGYIRLCCAISDGERFDLPLMGGVQDQVAFHTVVLLTRRGKVELCRDRGVISLGGSRLVNGRSRVVKGYTPRVIDTNVSLPFGMSASVGKSLARSLRYCRFAGR